MAFVAPGLSPCCVCVVIPREIPRAFALVFRGAGRLRALLLTVRRWMTNTTSCSYAEFSNKRPLFKSLQKH